MVAKRHMGQARALLRQQPHAHRQHAKDRIGGAPPRGDQQHRHDQHRRHNAARRIGHVHQADDAGALFGLVADLGQQAMAQGEERGFEHRNHHQGQSQRGKAWRQQNTAHPQQHQGGVGREQALGGKPFGD